MLVLPLLAQWHSPRNQHFLLLLALFIAQIPRLDGCCCGGCGCGCSYGCYQQQQPVVQYVPIPYPVNNNNNNNNGNGNANAHTYRNYFNGGNSGGGNGGSSSSSNGGNNNNANSNLASNAQTNALLASLVTQLERSNSLAANNAANSGTANAADKNSLLANLAKQVQSNNGGSSANNPVSYSNSNANSKLQQASSSSGSSSSSNKGNVDTAALLAALMAQLQQQQKPPSTTSTSTTKKTTTTTTTTTTPAPAPSFDFSAALQSLFANFRQPPPPPTEPPTTTSTTTTITTPKPVVLSQEQLDQLRAILAAIGGGGAAAQPQRARTGPKGIADLVAQDAAGGLNASSTPGPGASAEDDFYGFHPDEILDGPGHQSSDMASALPKPSRLLQLLHMAEAMDQMHSMVGPPEMAHARPLSSKLVAMLDPNATETTGPPPVMDPRGPPPVILKVNVPIPPAEKDFGIIRGNMFAWENGALTLEDMGRLSPKFRLVESGGFEKLNPAPADLEEGEELDDEQLQGATMGFYYKFDTYDARDTLEHADLGDEAYDAKMASSSEESGSRK